MDLLRVDPEQLESMQGNVEDIRGRYEGAYNRMYAAVESLRASYTGEAAEAFYTQIENFRNDFDALRQLFDKYAEFLKTEGNNYRFTDNNILDHVRTATSAGNSF